MKKINTRLLVICGTEDEDNGSATELVKLIPSAIYKGVPGNHNTAIRSKEFSAAVISFLRQ